MPGDAKLAMLPAGAVVGGRYEVQRTIATGGMGCVYLAHNRVLEMPVALKVLRPELSGDRRAVRRFGREASLAAQVSHPNVVRIVDSGAAEEGSPYLVMEYVSGPSLAALVRAEGPQPLARVVSLMQQLLAALDELHEYGIVHGDVTTQNLLLQPAAGGGACLKLVDFGLARRVGTHDAAARSGPREVSGTPGYMAPEARRGEPLGAPADMYSAGVVLHKLLTAELPDPALPPASPSVRFPHLEIPAALDALLARALSLDEADRLAAAPLSAALEAASRGRHPEPRGPWHPPADDARDRALSATLVTTRTTVR